MYVQNDLYVFIGKKYFDITGKFKMSEINK